MHIVKTEAEAEVPVPPHDSLDGPKCIWKKIFKSDLNLFSAF